MLKDKASTVAGAAQLANHGQKRPTGSTLSYFAILHFPELSSVPRGVSIALWCSHGPQEGPMRAKWLHVCSGSDASSPPY